ncbi:hypothetical protein MTO96_047648 [Rhipicephalus appendiculatus]
MPRRNARASSARDGAQALGSVDRCGRSLHGVVRGGRWCGQRAAGGGPGARRGAVVWSCPGPQRPEGQASAGAAGIAGKAPQAVQGKPARLPVGPAPLDARRQQRGLLGSHDCGHRRTLRDRHRCPPLEAHRREGRRLAVAHRPWPQISITSTKQTPNRSPIERTSNKPRSTTTRTSPTRTTSRARPTAATSRASGSSRTPSGPHPPEASWRRPRRPRVSVQGVAGTVLGHRRQSSLDSGCSLDMSSSSSSSGKGSPDPVAPTLTPPPGVRRHAHHGEETSVQEEAHLWRLVYGRCSRNHVWVSGSRSVQRCTEGPRHVVEPTPRVRQVSRSESCRPFSADSVPAPAFKTMSWDRHLLSSPSDRYLDDSERRCRSLSRPGRMPFSSHEEGSKRDPEWLEIARRRQATGVDWENLETHMKQPQSISCSNLSESHMRGKVSTLVSADRAGLRLVRSASALYPRIKMSRYERRMRRENPNPSPERRRSSDEFVLVSSSSSSSDAASAGASSTEDEKPSFLNVQLRHVEKAPPLNVVFQTRGGGVGGGVGVAGAVEPAALRSASPTLTWKSHREDNVAATTPSPTRLDRPSGASARSERAAAGRTRTASESLGVAEYLTPKRVELIEAPAPATKEGRRWSCTRKPDPGRSVRSRLTRWRQGWSSATKELERPDAQPRSDVDGPCFAVGHNGRGRYAVVDPGGRAQEEKRHRLGSLRQISVPDRWQAGDKLVQRMSSPADFGHRSSA